MKLLTLTTILTATLATAHMYLSFPTPLDNSDPDNNRPLSPSGSDFPCKGLLHLVSSTKSSVAWTAGQPVQFTIKGVAIHGGGSCQVSLSVDGGSTFRVLHSWEGNCPRTKEDNVFEFIMPRDVPEMRGAVFSWIWLNRLGNRELYMDCVVVDVVGRRGKKQKQHGSDKFSAISFNERPQIFVANLAGINSCKTLEGKPVKFPYPGPDVTSSDGEETADPVGDCHGGPGPAPAYRGGESHNSVEVMEPPAPTSGDMSNDLSTTRNPGTHETMRPDNSSGNGQDSIYRPGNDWPQNYARVSESGDKLGAVSFVSGLALLFMMLL
ncbi:hypothetical protein QBC38DRAFT_370868 [Podospora fimiseda]|uniref:Glycoside Hydrolase Family 61 n=1 Tax=Podospora fimiseda TaxID=252190 RepID=A0AAN7BJH1_9PEZI|nr:hypothetical protein QBC38DRAFT_370868 [Podospora fimiseda]